MEIDRILKKKKKVEVIESGLTREKSQYNRQWLGR